MPLYFICPFTIMRMSSISPSRMQAQRKFLGPSMGWVRRLIARWFCYLPSDKPCLA